MTEGRGNWRVHRDAADLAPLDALKDRDESVEIHRLGEAVPHGFLDQGMIGQVPRRMRIAHIVLARQRRREHGGQQVFRAHPLDLRRHPLAVGEPEQRQRAGGVPAPPAGEHGRRENRLCEHLAHGFRSHKPEDALQRKTVPFAQRDHNALVRRGSLELKIKGHTEPLAERQAPGAIHPPAERRMNDQLHPPALVEKPLGDDGLLSRHRAENLPAGDEIRDRLLRAAAVEAAFFLQPGEE